MPLLNIRVAKKVTITCSLEESIANQANEYAAFLKVLPDEVINKALEYVFGKDKDFQQFREQNPHAQAPGALRMKKPVGAPKGSARGRKPTLVAAV